jgi:hypothetical protein
MIADTVSRLAARGAGEFSNEDFLLVGGFSSDAASANETVAGSYAVFDARLLAAGGSRADAALGRIEIFLHPRSLLIEGLSRMEIPPGRRQRGAGRRLIQALAASAPEFRLNIYDIRPPALDFWIALGCSFRPRPGGWDGSYVLPTALRRAPAEALPERNEEKLRA